ncbi:hypothetical protein [Nonomuraea sp. NPDC049400]|uniref:hypothetical protein n=1 Tax=Nonomuraea sp. NPDC049400 TaxID=3364352 RepID=UPI00378FA67E
MMTDTRLTTHCDVSTTMARYDDRELAELLEREAVPLGTGIGGASARLEVCGTSVFIKRVPLTEPELRHPHSTADLFGLPPFLPVRHRLARLRRLARAGRAHDDHRVGADRPIPQLPTAVSLAGAA